MIKLDGKKVLVLGFGKSGKAAIKILLKLNAKVTLYESNKIENSNENNWVFSNTINIINDFNGDETKLFDEEFDFVVKSPGIPYKSWYICKLKERKVPIISEIELGYMLAEHHKYIAITGTNGKTTTTTLVFNIIKNQYPTSTFIAGNIGIPLCQVILDNDLINRNNCFIVLEISNYQLMDIISFKPFISTIINLTPDHLDHIDTIEEYYESKTNIYRNMSFNDTFILNHDDPIINKYTKKIPAKCNIINFSFKNHNSDCFCTSNHIVFNSENIIDISKIKIVGKHSLQNIMVAICIVKTIGINTQSIQAEVYAFKGVEHRIEFVKEIDGVKYYNDSKATNVDATETALKAFQEPIILLIGGYEKNLNISSLKKYLSKIKLVIGFGSCGERLVKDLTNDKGIIVNGLYEAFLKASEFALPGDVVLLSPTTSSFDQFSCFEERGDYFKGLVNNTKE